MDLKKSIEQFEGMIAEVKDLVVNIEAKETEYYNKGWEMLRNGFLPSAYDFKTRKIKKLEGELKLLKILQAEYGDKLEDLSIYKSDEYGVNIYLGFRPYKSLSLGIYLESKDSWLYHSYITSHSGLNEWASELIDKKVSLYIGHSDFSHAFGNVTVGSALRVIEDLSEVPELRFDKIKKVIKLLTENDKISKQLKKEFDLMFKFMFENKEE